MRVCCVYYSFFLLRPIPARTCCNVIYELLTRSFLFGVQISICPLPFFSFFLNGNCRNVIGQLPVPTGEAPAEWVSFWRLGIWSFRAESFWIFYLDTSENGNWNRIFVKEIPVNGGCYDVWVIVFYVKGVLLLCMGVVIRASIAGPPVAWAIGLQSPMVKIGTPATNYTARWLSLGRLEIRQMNGITARNLKPVFCNIWFCGRLFLLLFCLFRAHFHELVAAVSRTIRTRSEQIAQKQRKKKTIVLHFDR